MYRYIYREGRRLYTETAGSLALALRFAREDKWAGRVPVRIVASDGRELYNRAELKDFVKGGR
jgi:hypothetical protein